MQTRNIYWRKSKRHHWNCIAQCRDSNREFIRQLHMAQVDAPEWEIGWTTEDHMGLYPDNKKANYPMKLAPNITDKAIVRALESFINSGFTPINPPIMGVFVELELLGKGGGQL